MDCIPHPDLSSRSDQDYAWQVIQHLTGPLAANSHGARACFRQNSAKGLK